MPLTEPSLLSRGTLSGNGARKDRQRWTTRQDLDLDLRPIAPDTYRRTFPGVLQRQIAALDFYSRKRGYVHPGYFRSCLPQEA